MPELGHSQANDACRDEKHKFHRPLRRGMVPSPVLRGRIDELRTSHDGLAGSLTTLDESMCGDTTLASRMEESMCCDAVLASQLCDGVMDSPRRHRRLDATASAGLSAGLMARSASVRHRRNIDDVSELMPDAGVSPWGKCFNINKKPITSDREFVSWLVSDISKAVESGGQRHTNRFFNIVLGGNVHLVKAVLEYLRTYKKYKELAWILGSDSVKTDSKQCSTIRRLLNGLIFFLWVILFLVLTPVFYTFHVITFSAHLATRGRMSQSINLPIVFTVFSEDPEMVRVFMASGCQIESQDSGGNNIYHYLADLSQDQPEKAVRCHSIICECVENLDVLRTLIVEQTNALDITALEAIAKYGSMYFLRIIMLDRSCIGNLKLSVSKTIVWADVPDHTFDINTGADVNQEYPEGYCADAALNVLEFDISRYEKGDIFGRQSYLLQLIGSRSVESMKEVDIWSLIQSKLVEKWTRDKFQSYMPACLFGHVMYVLVTVLLLVFVVNHGGDMNERPIKDLYSKYDIELFLQAGQKAMLTAINSEHNQSEPTDASMWDDTCVGWNVTWDEKYLKVFREHDLYLDNCSATALAKVNEACGQLKPLELVGLFKGSDKPDRVTHTTAELVLSIILLGQICVDLVIREGFLFSNFNFRAQKVVNGFLPVLVRRYPGSYTEKHLSALIFIFYAAFSMFHTLWIQGLREQDVRTYAYFNSLFSNTPRSQQWQNQTRILADRLRIQLQEVEDTVGIVSNLMIICLMLRFLHTIHSLRLLPGVGFFVITTKKMAKHLLQFTIVFMIVSLSFATIFYFVMRQTTCPALKIEGFETLVTSLFSTYQVSLGYGEYDFTNNLNARIAYVAYTIMTILLLMNLIIAVMTTTAEELNQMPWREALCCLEQWDEILGVEITARTVITPIRLIHRTLKRCVNIVFRRRGPAWTNIKQTGRKTFEVTFLK